MKDINLQHYGLRRTLPRIQVLRILDKNQDSHLSANEIHSLLQHQNSGIGLSTIYQVLSDLTDVGILCRHQFSHDSHHKYEISSAMPHHHLVCRQCHKIIDIYDSEIEQQHEHIAKQHNFTLDSQPLTLYGNCRNTHCSQTNSNISPAITLRD